MSKTLSRVRALVSEIDAIQTQGRILSSPVPFMKTAQSDKAQSESTTPESNNVIQMNSPVSDTSTTNAAPPEGKVKIQMTGNIAVQLQLEDTDEIVEVRQLGETIEIRFTDGKAIHLPLKNVA